MKIQGVDRVRATAPVRRQGSGISRRQEDANEEVPEDLEPQKIDPIGRPDVNPVDEYARAT